MSDESRTPTPTTLPAPRELDMDACNAIGEWICMAHVSERVLMCRMIRELLTSVDDGVEKLPDFLKSEKVSEELQAKVMDLVKPLVASFWDAVRGLEDGAHVNPVAAPTHYRYPVTVAGKERVFGLQPNEYKMATDPTCTPRPWSPEPKE